MQALSSEIPATWLSMIDITHQLSITPRTLDWLVERGRVQTQFVQGERKFRLAVGQPFETGELKTNTETNEAAVAGTIRWRPMRMALDSSESERVDQIRDRIQKAKNEFEALYDRSEIPGLKL